MRISDPGITAMATDWTARLRTPVSAICDRLLASLMEGVTRSELHAALHKATSFDNLHWLLRCAEDPIRNEESRRRGRNAA